MRYLLILMLGIFTTSFQFTTNQKETVDLKIVITNINTLKGNINLGLFNSSKTFLNKGQEFRVISEKVTENTMTIRFNNLPKGTYAFSAFHDINSDKVCNLSLLFRPIEPIGFSNNIKLNILKPTYQDCKFNLNVDRLLTVKIADL